MHSETTLGEDCSTDANDSGTQPPSTEDMQIAALRHLWALYVDKAGTIRDPDGALRIARLAGTLGRRQPAAARAAKKERHVEREDHEPPLPRIVRRIIDPETSK